MEVQLNKIWNNRKFYNSWDFELKIEVKKREGVVGKDKFENIRNNRRKDGF